MSIEENTEFLRKMAALLGRKITLAESYIAYALRDGKYKVMSAVPPLPVHTHRFIQRIDEGTESSYEECDECGEQR